MKKNKRHLYEDCEISFKKKPNELRSSRKSNCIDDFGLFVDSNGIPIKVGDLVKARLKTGKVLENCEVIELREKGILTIIYDDPRGPITSFSALAKEVTVL